MEVAASGTTEMKKTALIHLRSLALLLTVAAAAIGNEAAAAERIVCHKNFLMSSAAGVKAGPSGKDEYAYVPGKYLEEILDGRPIWSYRQVSEENGLIVAALRQQKHPADTQVVVIDRNTKELYKTVKQGKLRFTSFGTCDFLK